MGTIRIRAKDGSVIDLEALREHWFLIGGTPFMTVASHDLLVVIEALQAALSVSKDMYGNEDCTFGYHTAIADVREAANVIEENPVAD